MKTTKLYLEAYWELRKFLTACFVVMFMINTFLCFEYLIWHYAILMGAIQSIILFIIMLMIAPFIIRFVDYIDD